MLTKVCSDCRRAKRLELFDIDRRRPDGRSAECKDCRRQRQNRGGYATSRGRALAALAGRYPDEYEHYREKARIELAPDTAGAEVWHRARRLALAEIARRHPGDWQRRFQQVCTAHPDWTHGRRFFVEVVPGVVELEVAVPRLRPAKW